MKRAITALVLAALLSVAVTSQGLADENDDDEAVSSCPNPGDIVLSTDLLPAIDLNGDGLVCVDVVSEQITDNILIGRDDDDDDDDDDGDDDDDDDDVDDGDDDN